MFEGTPSRKDTAKTNQERNSNRIEDSPQNKTNQNLQ
jgi:hypothetical protein